MNTFEKSVLSDEDKVPTELKRYSMSEPRNEEIFIMRALLSSMRVLAKSQAMLIYWASKKLTI